MANAVAQPVQTLSECPNKSAQRAQAPPNGTRWNAAGPRQKKLPSGSCISSVSHNEHRNVLRFVVDQRLTSNSGIRASNGSIHGKDANAGIIAPVPVGQRNSRKSPLRHPMRGATLRRFVNELQFSFGGHTGDGNVLANSPKARL